MKRLIAVLLVVALALPLAACAKSHTIDNVTYDIYGLLNEGEKKNPDIAYQVSWGNVFWGVLLFETVIAPIYFFGFALYEPVGKTPAIKGQVPA